MKGVQLGNGGPPGGFKGAVGWRAAVGALRSNGAMVGVRGAIAGVVADVANVMLPTDCRICGAALVLLGTVRVCEACVARVAPQPGELQETLCARCGDAMGMESERFAAAMGVTECTMCRLAPPEFERAVAFANYDNEMREMLHLLKFEGMRSVAEHVLGERLAEAARTLRGCAGNDLMVIPVPLFRARERKRGFNQAGLLAEAAVKRLRRLEPEWRLRISTTVLSRVKDTRALYRLTPTQRRRDLRGAFRVVDKAAVQGREVMLVDDILTTGATARECARVLLAAGAAKVWVVTAAKAQPESPAAAEASQSFARWTAPAVKPGLVVEPDSGRRKSF